MPGRTKIASNSIVRGELVLQLVTKLHPSKIGRKHLRGESGMTVVDGPSISGYGIATPITPRPKNENYQQDQK
jgi:hypothetical protein